MNKKMMKILILATLVILVAAPESYAKRQYFTALDTVYPGGSCGTCHVSASGGGPRNSYGTLFEGQPNFDNDPAAALKAIGAPTTTTPAVTVTETPKSPGFGILLSLAGLFTWALLIKRNN